MTGIIGAVPNKPPKSICSPTPFPVAGMTRTAVVLLLITPMAASSAIMPLIVSAVVSPGTAIMSNPTEHTAVIASNFSMFKLPLDTARIISASSETGMNAPDKPPTCSQAMTPPFLTASFNNANAAVVPGAPTLSRPISSRISATESPSFGVGANDKSTIPNGTPSVPPQRCRLIDPFE